MPFGMNPIASWASLRLGGVQPEALEAVYVAFDLASVNGATKVRVGLTKPDGSAVEKDCDSSPCVVQTDRRQGSYLVTLQYLSSTGGVLAKSQKAVPGRAF